MRNILVVLSGPSGVGKGTIAKRLIDRNNDISLSISCTTRNPRDGEIDGKDYFFIQKPQFLQKIDEQGFLEYSEHFENFYGTPKDFVLETLKEKDVLLEIDVNGGLKIKESYPDAVLIMITPPSIQEIRNRLINRHTESEEKIELRMQRIEYELDKQDLYDYSVVNDQLEQAIIDIENIIKSEKIK
ncbi:MAG: guanylate kinase [Clostridiales bacterium]|nr:guanylate kinase [Clostridiales bacterium]